MKECNIRSYKISHERFSVEALFQRIGNDILLSVWGGEAHIGAVAMAEPRASLSDPEKVSSTVSVHCYTGHKEDDLVKKAAEQIASAFSARTVVVAGLHWDDLTEHEVSEVVEIAQALFKKIIKEERDGSK